MDSEANRTNGGGAHQPAPIRPASTPVSTPISALTSPLAVAPLLAQHEQIQPFHLLARPRRLAQKAQAGGDAGVHIEAAQLDTVSQAKPAVVIHQLGHDALQRDAVQGVAGLLLWSGRHAPIVAQRRGGLQGRGLCPALFARSEEKWFGHPRSGSILQQGMDYLFVFANFF